MDALASITAADGSCHSGAVGSPRTAMSTHFCAAAMPPHASTSDWAIEGQKLDAIGCPFASTRCEPSALIATATAAISGSPLVGCTPVMAATATMSPVSSVTAVAGTDVVTPLKVSGTDRFAGCGSTFV